jgi:hypothetical protein
MPGLVPGMFVFGAQLRQCPVSRARFGNTRHCEEQSDEAIQNRAAIWIASLRSQ